jgi:hypothetical protein
MHNKYTRQSTVYISKSALENTLRDNLLLVNHRRIALYYPTAACRKLKILICNHLSMKLFPKEENGAINMCLAFTSSAS